LSSGLRKDRFKSLILPSNPLFFISKASFNQFIIQNIAYVNNFQTLDRTNFCLEA